jgi:signal transduction histidine kinase
MQSFAKILEEDCGEKVGAQGKDYIRRIITGAGRMDKLILDVLTYSRVTRTEYEMRSVELDALLKGILESYPAFHRPQAEIELVGTFPVVTGNEAALTQCISNLLGNAVKFVASGTVPRVRVWSERHKGLVRLFVQDNGIGIPEDAGGKIFGIFQRFTKQYEGTGIGLAIVRKAIERMGGRVGYESAPGKGSTFWLELKAANGTH